MIYKLKNRQKSYNSLKKREICMANYNVNKTITVIGIHFPPKIKRKHSNQMMGHFNQSIPYSKHVKNCFGGSGRVSLIIMPRPYTFTCKYVVTYQDFQTRCSFL